MTQLILDVGGAGLRLPETRKQAYSARKEHLYQDVKMISGRLTREYKDYVWAVDYQYGYFSELDRNAFLTACEKGVSQGISCSFVDPKTNEMLTKQFLVTAYTEPKFMWSSYQTKDGEETTVGLWGGYSVTLREVKPSA